jgi:hypothetical protein
MREVRVRGNVRRSAIGMVVTWNGYCTLAGGTEAKLFFKEPRWFSVAEIENQTDDSYEETYEEDDDRFALLWVAIPICALIIGSGALYLGNPVLLPLAIALIMSVVFSPVASRLEPSAGASSARHW